jgi:hypothetical protein
VDFITLSNNANWLVKNAKSFGNYSILEYKFPFARYDMEPPWRSALAQGKAIEALTKAYDVTSNKTYIDTAKSLLNSFFVEVKDGGVTLKTADDGWWYEEYADDGSNSSRVLNGMIWALLSIYDYYKYTNDTNAKFLFDQGVIALKNTLPLYDNSGNSYYDIHRRTTLIKYHQMHIKLLDYLSNITDEAVFAEYRGKWQNYMRSSDITPPLIVNMDVSNFASNPNPSSITVKFNEAMNKNSINTSTLLVKKDNNKICTSADHIVHGLVRVSPDGKSAIFKPFSDLSPHAKYKVIVTAEVRDTAGNKMAADKAWSFRTATSGGQGQKEAVVNTFLRPLLEQS